MKKSILLVCLFVSVASLTGCTVNNYYNVPPPPPPMQHKHKMQPPPEHKHKMPPPPAEHNDNK